MAKGSCMCGAIHYEYTGEPEVTALCHCTDCHKWTGAAYTSTVAVPRTSFKITEGFPKDYAAVGASGNIKTYFFCGACGSSLYAELDVMPDVTCVKSGTLDGGAANHAIDMEFYTKDRLAYVKPVEGAGQELEFPK